MFQFMEKSPTVFPNALLSKQDFQKEEHFHKKCMVFVFMTRWVYGQDGQKQWRNFSLRDLKMNMRAFESWKKKGQLVMRHCPEYQKLPLVCKDQTKRKRQGRGRWMGKRKAPVESSSATDSPMKKVNFNLTEWTSDSEVELLEVKPAVASSEEEQR